MLNSIFKSGPVFALALSLLSVWVVAAPSPVSAQEYYTVRQLLAEQFKSSERVSYVRVRPSGEQRARIEHRLGRDLSKSDYTVYVAKTGERVDGYALFDDELGQHEPISFATFFDAQGKVTRVEVVAYREAYGDGVRAQRFRRQFVGKDAHSGFAPQSDIDAISGATISSRALCVGVQRAALVLDETVLRGRTVVATLSGR
jgi:Na+-translocating ferredoxin:NAD+ oxidoreductase RnfG subunit